MDLASAKAVISGGASGLGLATAKRVIDTGGFAALLDVNEEQGIKNAEDLGERAIFLNTDVSDEDGVRASINNAC
jgi:NAD(P)-dependent dehydrogenase (short-subunit alcohol dehydrogenase family)